MRIAILCPYCRKCYISGIVNEEQRESEFIRFITCDECGRKTEIRKGYIDEYIKKGSSNK